MAGFQLQMPGQGGRKTRYPKHPFQVSHMPYHICPFMIAPVLPGETLKKLMWQSRAVSDPIKNPLVGWWLEYYYFYVKLSDLYAREDFREMVLNPSFTPATITATQTGTALLRDHYYPGGTGMIDYVELCLRRVVDEWFRDEGETYADHRFSDAAVSGRTYPLAQIVGNSVLDSVSLVDDETAVDVTLLDAAAVDTLTASEVATGMRLWEMQRQYGITEMSYEDWLATFGVKAEAEEAHRPELIRYVRDWTYPTNTIDPTNGAARSAVSWTVQERADKARAFREPGFIVGYTCARPKVYIRQQEGTFAAMMNDFKSWLPPWHQQDTAWSRLVGDAAAGPLATIVADANGYVVDIKDLLLYGEQFTNETLSATDKNFMDAISANLTTGARYPIALADIQELFVTATSNFIRQDGVADLMIACSPLNRIVDTSPRGGNRSYITSGG